MKLLTHDNTVIVAYTGHAPDWAREELAKAGADGYELHEVAFADYLPGDDIKDWDTATGIRIVPRVIVEPALTQKQQIANEMAELGAYLSHTDWYAIRNAETGATIPSEIVAKRAEARDRISALREMQEALKEKP